MKLNKNVISAWFIILMLYQLFLIYPDEFSINLYRYLWSYSPVVVIVTVFMDIAMLFSLLFAAYWFRENIEGDKNGRRK